MLQEYRRRKASDKSRGRKASEKISSGRKALKASEESSRGRKPSEISIQKDREGPADTYVVTIDNNHLITTTLTDSERTVREWVREIQAIYGKKKRQILVGLSAISKEHFADNGGWRLRPKEKRESRYDLLQLCVGSHCLLMELHSYLDDGFMPRVVKDFLYDNQTIFFGVGIHLIANKLVRQTEGLIITNIVELKKMAEKYLPGNKFEECSTEELAMVVLEGKVDVVKPKVMKWSEQMYPHQWELSKEMIKYATVEAFLACQMGSKLWLESQ